MSDEFTVPVCRFHHRELHRCPDEAAWWQKLNIDPVSAALRLWQQTRTERALLEPDGANAQSEPSKARAALEQDQAVGADPDPKAGTSSSTKPDERTSL